MSICSSTIRALSRSRISQSKTLLPFLYQTVTIQQWRPLAGRNIASRSKDGDDIPFEDESLPPAIDQAEPARKTTITGSERAAFEKLYRTFNTQGRTKNDKEHVVELDQIADEYYEDDEEAPSQSLDKVFDEVFKGEPRLRASRSNQVRSKVEKKKPGQEVPASADDTTSPRTNKAQTKGKDAKAEAAKIKEMKLAERERVDKLLQKAQTDRALWKILDREVFDQVRKLDLDGTKKSSGKQPQSSKTSTASRKPKSETTAASDPRILFQNYPHHLITAVQTLRTTFPSSPLPLSILPTIKSLGRSSYALGATTTLYKHLLRTAWLQQSSYTYIDTLLVDMNNGAVEFDSDILTLLDSIIRENDMARGGRLGREMQMVYGMEQFVEGMRKIKQWRGVVAERLGVVSGERRVEPQSVVRKVVRDSVVRRAVPQSVVRKVEFESRGGDVERFRGSRHERTGRDEGRLRRDDGSRGDIPLVEGVNNADQGARKPRVENGDAEVEREPELFVQDVAEERSREYQQTEKEATDDSTSPKILL